MALEFGDRVNYQNANKHAKQTEEVHDWRKEKPKLGWVLQTNLKGNHQPNALKHVQTVAKKYCKTKS
jgi:hypothetical protein